MSEHNEVYWRIYRSHRDDKPVAVCMQWFDEYDYDQDRFLTKEQFATEAEANEWIAALTDLRYAAVGKAVCLLLGLEKGV